MTWIDILLDKMGRGEVLSTIDLTKGSWQIPLAKADRQKTAFATLLGLYHFTKIPFGLNGDATSFQRGGCKGLCGHLYR